MPRSHKAAVTDLYYAFILALGWEGGKSCVYNAIGMAVCCHIRIYEPGNLPVYWYRMEIQGYEELAVLFLQPQQT